MADLFLTQVRALSMADINGGHHDNFSFDQFHALIGLQNAQLT
jgi:hypothetical protein